MSTWSNLEDTWSALDSAWSEALAEFGSSTVDINVSSEGDGSGQTQGVGESTVDVIVTPSGFGDKEQVFGGESTVTIEVIAEGQGTELNVPIIDLSLKMPFHGVLVDITNPSWEADGVLYNEIYRRVLSEEDWLLLGFADPDDEYVDYEAATGVEYEYIATAVNNLGNIDSDPKTFEVNFDEWFIKDLDTIEDSISIFVDGDRDLEIENREEQSSFNPLGRKYPLVIKDDKVKSDRLGIIVQFLNDNEYKSFDKLRQKQKTLLLQSPMNSVQWYFVFGSQSNQTVLNTVDAYRKLSAVIVEVERP